VKDALGDVQTVVVLGGTSELALATVRALAARRLRTVVLAARSPEACGTARAELEALGLAVHTVAFDGAAVDTHETVLDECWAAAGGDVDVVLLAFGVLGSQAEFDADPAAAGAAATVNFTGAVTSGLGVASRLRAQGHGTLVVFSSVAGVRARKANFVYGATKAGVDAFAQGLGDSLHGSGARVLVVRPGFVRTKMTEGLPDAPFATTAEAVGADVAAGIRSGAAVVWSPAVLRYVFGTLRLAPRAVWRRLPG
jgi:decaprenylphospho-beta-D-erythro-pentofuranosid-2-ulose 2-reductase